MGCGRVGSSLARSLERRGHSVAVIDLEADAFRRLGPTYRGRTVKGVGFDRKVLEAAGIREAGGFAAVSSGDNSNILAARVVRETYGVHNVVARIYDQGRAAVYERLGIPSVATVRWASDQVLRRLLPEGSVQLVSGSIRDVFDHAKLGDIARLSHPTHDHFLPLLYAAGAAAPDEVPRFFNTGFQAASISMRSVLWG